jgi:hypothetical protein
MPVPNPHYASTYWRTIRQQCLTRDNHRCRLCNSSEQLEAHHRTYERAGQEQLEDLTTLCKQCHDVVTDHQRRIRFAVRVLPALGDILTPNELVSTSRYQEVVIETRTVVPLDWSRTAADALWTTRRPVEPLDQGH